MKARKVWLHFWKNANLPGFPSVISNGSGLNG
jgi:hypothetical protein